jgi:hypothetical protein
VCVHSPNNLLRAEIPSYRERVIFSTYFETPACISSLQSRFLLTHGTRFAQTFLLQLCSPKAASPIHRALVRPSPAADDQLHFCQRHTHTWILLQCRALRRRPQHKGRWQSEVSVQRAPWEICAWYEVGGRRDVLIFFWPSTRLCACVVRPTRAVVVLLLLLSSGFSLAAGMRFRSKTQQQWLALGRFLLNNSRASAALC